MAYPISKQFLLPDDKTSVKPLMEEILDHIIGHIPAQANTADNIFRIEVIIIELLTNGIKHAGLTDTLLEVAIQRDRLTFHKKDHGNRFDPGNIMSSANSAKGYKQLLTKDDLHNMYVVVENDTTLRFECEEVNGNVALNLNNLIEHFGLLIITKASNNFTYHHNARTGLNTFSVTVDLK